MKPEQIGPKSRFKTRAIFVGVSPSMVARHAIQWVSRFTRTNRMNQTATAIDHCINRWEACSPAAKFQKCLDALSAPPMTAAERAAYDSQRAAEMARAERRRQPSPQLQLGE